MLSLGYAYFGAIDRLKLREEFLIYLDRFSPHRKTREFEVAVNGKTSIEFSQMDTAENERAFYKQATTLVKRRREKEKMRFRARE